MSYRVTQEDILSLRADAADSSILPKDNRWGFFPAAAFSSGIFFICSQMPFIFLYLSLRFLASAEGGFRMPAAPVKMAFPNSSGCSAASHAATRHPKLCAITWHGTKSLSCSSCIRHPAYSGTPQGSGGRPLFPCPGKSGIRIRKRSCMRSATGCIRVPSHPHPCRSSSFSSPDPQSVQKTSAPLYSFVIFLPVLPEHARYTGIFSY